MKKDKKKSLKEYYKVSTKKDMDKITEKLKKEDPASYQYINKLVEENKKIIVSAIERGYGF